MAFEERLRRDVVGYGLSWGQIGAADSYLLLFEIQPFVGTLVRYPLAGRWVTVLIAASGR